MRGTESVVKVNAILLAAQPVIGIIHNTCNLAATEAV